MTKESTITLDEFYLTHPTNARLFGLDLGSKTIGIALSDTMQTIASGLITLKRKKFSKDAEQVLELADEHDVAGFIIGLPLNMDGSEGPRVQSTKAFVRNFGELTDLPIIFWDERLSSKAAERTLLDADASRKRRSEVIDKLAATYILQGALDRLSEIKRNANTPEKRLKI